MDRRHFLTGIAVTAAALTTSACGNHGTPTPHYGPGTRLQAGTPRYNHPDVIICFTHPSIEVLDDIAPELAKRYQRATVAVHASTYAHAGIHDLSPGRIKRLCRDYQWEAAVTAADHGEHLDSTLDTLLGQLKALGVDYPTTYLATTPRVNEEDAAIIERHLQRRIIPTAAERTATSIDTRTSILGAVALNPGDTPNAQQAHLKKITRYIDGCASQGRVAIITIGDVTQGPDNLYRDAIIDLCEWIYTRGLSTGLPSACMPANHLIDPTFRANPLYGWGTTLAYPWGVSPYQGGWSKPPTGANEPAKAGISIDATDGWSAVSQSVSLIPGQDYEIRALIEVEDTGGFVGVQLRRFTETGAGDTIAAPINVTEATPTAQEFRGSFTAPDDVDTVLLDVVAEGATTATVAWVSIMDRDTIERDQRRARSLSG